MQNNIEMETDQIRYDRQIRLWGEEGQYSIQKARVCVFGSSALASEILKSLVLAGIGSFHIVDDTLVDRFDLGQNFFLDDESIGSNRAECVVKYLSELNPFVKGYFYPVSFDSFTDIDFKNLHAFSVIISTNLTEKNATKLSGYLFERSIPFIYTRVCGLFGYLRLSFKEHVIWNNHSENDPYDLRLDHPFDELLELVKTTDLDSMTHEQHSHTPYIILYLKALEKWRYQLIRNDAEQMSKTINGETTIDPAFKDIALFPDVSNYKTRKELERILMEMRMPDDKGCLDEDNFDEAKRNLFKGLCATKVPPKVQQVLTDPKASGELDVENFSEECLQTFWVLTAALNVFIHRHHQQMPVSGQLPDMTSDTKRYTQLLDIYRKKSAEHSIELCQLANSILSKRVQIRDQWRLKHSISVASDSSSITSISSGSSYAPDASMAEGSGSNPYSYLSSAQTNVTITTMQSVTSTSIATTDDDGDLSRMSVSTSGGDAEMAIDSNNSNIATAAPTEFATSHENDFASNISLEDCQKFCKNVHKIGVQYGTSLDEEFAKGVEVILGQIVDPDLGQRPLRVDPLVWIILLRAMDRFQAEKDRFPGTNGVPCTIDSKDLKRRVDGLIAETKNTELVERQSQLVPQEAIEEICRYGASEPHVTAAIIGACVAQEAIKLCTHQYVPVDNALIYDAHSQEARTIRV